MENDTPFDDNNDREEGDWDPTAMADLQNDKEFCDDCGAPLKISKKGNKYCGALCWTKTDEKSPLEQVDDLIKQAKKLK